MTSEAMSGPTAPVTREEAIQFTAAALNHIFESGIVSNALSKAIGDLGWTGCQAPAAPPSVIKQMDKKSGKKSGKEEGVKEKSRRPIGPYMLFMNLMMERISKDPQNPAFKVEEKVGENGQPVPVRGGKMTIASKIWHGMSESSKQAFNATFKPLCDVLNSEALASGEKHDLTSRLQTFQSSLNSTMRKQLEDSISSAVAALAKGKDVNGTPATASKPPKEESSEEESSEEESSEPEPPKPVKSAEKKKRKASEPSSTKKSKKKSKKESTFSEEESD